MTEHGKPRRKEPSLVGMWFKLTVQEQWFIAGIVLIALIGLSARYIHLKNQEPDPYEIEEGWESSYYTNPASEPGMSSIRFR